VAGVIAGVEAKLPFHETLIPPGWRA
jgi:hypothetical protein